MRELRPDTLALSPHPRARRIRPTAAVLYLGGLGCPVGLELNLTAVLERLPGASYLLGAARHGDQKLAGLQPRLVLQGLVPGDAQRHEAADQRAYAGPTDRPGNHAGQRPQDDKRARH